MSKHTLASETGIAVEFGTYYEFFDISLDEDTGRIIAQARVAGELRTKRLKPKHLRRFANALLALADQVDSPVRYFRYTEPTEMTYRLGRNGDIHYWSAVSGRWVNGGDNFKWLKKHRELVEIATSDLPEAAR